VQYVRPDVATLVIGQAYGNACMLLAAGTPGKRAALPHARIKMATPRINRSFGSTTDVMIKANELEQNTDMYIDFLAKFTGKDKDQVFEDCARDKCDATALYIHVFTPPRSSQGGGVKTVSACKIIC
jgi:ATP-dependent Clp protease, protease subunit